MHQDEELHDELLKAFRAYFAANQEWLNKQTKQSAIRLRQRLSDIRRICSQRRVVVREWGMEKEAQLAARRSQRKDQTND
jgi:hypothetical protein